MTDRVVSHTRVGDDDVLAFELPVGDWVVAGDEFVAGRCSMRAHAMESASAGRQTEKKCARAIMLYRRCPLCVIRKCETLVFDAWRKKMKAREIHGRQMWPEKAAHA